MSGLNLKKTIIKRYDWLLLKEDGIYSFIPGYEELGGTTSAIDDSLKPMKR